MAEAVAGRGEVVVVDRVEVEVVRTVDRVDEDVVDLARGIVDLEVLVDDDIAEIGNGFQCRFRRHLLNPGIDHDVVQDRAVLENDRIDIGNGCRAGRLTQHRGQQHGKQNSGEECPHEAPAPLSSSVPSRLRVHRSVLSCAPPR